MSENKIVIIEDEPDILEILKYNLERENFNVQTALDGLVGLKLIQRELPSLIILDLMLPGIDGIEICQRLKRDARTSAIPIIMLTAKGEESDIILGLGVGADDYITKPFSPRELIARVKATIRRGSFEGKTNNNDVITVGELLVNKLKHQVIVNNQEIKVTATEFRLLAKLAANPGQVFSREQLLDDILGNDVVVVDRNVDVHIRSIRKKIGEKLIETIRGVGYRFKETG
ncbi:MAG: two-component system alkaline phosphatase synthesis response regulator PhoP [Candidatus Azotimanducaceae bacterium]|jgi:two-component system alkaline phosphatase synthesis response regulator PhoP